MDCVKLYFKDSLIGVLTYDEINKEFIFVKNKFFLDDEILKITGFNNKNEVYYSKSLFLFFKLMLNKFKNTSYTYKDVVKLANNKFSKEKFWIEV